MTVKQSQALFLSMCGADIALDGQSFVSLSSNTFIQFKKFLWHMDYLPKVFSTAKCYHNIAAGNHSVREHRFNCSHALFHSPRLSLSEDRQIDGAMPALPLR